MRQKTKLNNVRKFVESTRWFKAKNFKHLSIYCAHFESTYAQQEHKCWLTGEHALCTIQHKRRKGEYKDIVKGLSGTAIKMIEEIVGHEFYENRWSS